MSTRKCTKHWTQKNGTKIRICDMSDSHLTNAVRYLRRAADAQVAEIGPPSFSGEMAQYYADREYDSLLASTPDELAARMYDLYDDLMEEAARRKLEIN